MIHYQFIVNNGTESRTCYPRWKADTAISYAFEQQQMFRRAQLSNNLIFVGTDYDWLMATDFEAKFTVQIKADWTGSGYYSNYWAGSFHKTDATINVDKKMFSVKPTVEDRYNAILAGLEKEYDLIKLTPAIQPVHLTRRPMLQIYSAGEEVVSCFLSSMAWEQECESVTNVGKILDDYHFGKIGEYVEISFDSNVFIGTKQSHSNTSGEWNDYGNNGTYKMNYYQEIYSVGQNVVFRNGIRVYRNGTQVLIWEFYQESLSGFNELPDEFTLAAQQSGYSNQPAQMTTSQIFGRWCVAAQLEGCYAIDQDDLVTYNRNYKYCKPYDGDEIIEMTYNSSDTPTEWGVRTDGTYYVKPREDTFAYNLFPVARSTWSKASLWYVHNLYVEALETNLRVSTLLRDAFTLEAVIKALLSQIDNTIQFDGTQLYSRFLFGTNPLFDGSWGRLVMTPKSNILVAEYTQPARKAPITLAEVFKMLRDALGCYWYIDDANRLIIEHVSWFKNGGSYSGTQAVGIDVAAAVNTRNGKALTFGTNEYSYEKLDMPERYQYEWMDDTTAIFKGDPIEVVSTYVERGKIEEITVAGFNPDIDYMMLNPSMVSEDGMALMCCSVSNGEYSVGINKVNNFVTKVQNWQLSMTKLIPNFLISDMPSWNIKVGQNQLTAKGIQRKKQQKIDIPVGSTEPNMQLLVQTGVGVGEIQQMDIKLTSRMAKTTLRYDTTQQ